MLKENRILYSLDDVAIQPAGMSRVSSRFKCNPYINDRLPIFTAPMPCVVDFDTEQTYLDAHINPIIPRGHVKDIKNLNDRIRHSEFGFTAFSLSEFLNCFFYQDGKLDPDKKRYVLIDNANGNMKQLIDLIKLVKQSENTKNIVVMAGNVANPETFKLLAEVGADYIRVSVGSGDACTTAVNLGVYYPMASLINDCYYYKLLNKKLNDHETKIVADGGFKTMSQIIKALALGADYVMLGSMLNSCADSAGRIVLHNDHHYKEYYGMASKEGMEKLGKTGHYAPEGKIVYNTITDKVSIFSENLAAYIRSAMSYCDAYTLDEFIGQPVVNIISENASNRFK